MAEDFDFDDKDEALLNLVCTPPSAVDFPTTKHSRQNDENVPVKKVKLDKSELEKTCVTSSFQNGVRRIFPGPAGIVNDELQTDVNKVQCTQYTASMFNDGPWESMSKDFYLGNGSYLYDTFNILWIKKQASTNKFVDKKAPFLTGILQSLEVSEGKSQNSVNIMLKDTTGQIQGMIQQSLYEEYANYLSLGSVLVLAEFGVLSCNCDKCDNHHLTITPNNLCSIYTSKERIIIKEVKSQQIIKDYATLNEPSRKNEKETLDTVLRAAEKLANKKEKNVKELPATSSSDVVTMAGSQISIKVDNKEHKEIWENLLEGVDVDSFFEEL